MVEFGRTPRLLLGTAVAAGVLTLGGDAAKPPLPKGVFIDCAEYPGASAGVVVNTKKTSETDLGNMNTTTNQWRENVTVMGLGAGELALIAEGFGPVLSYDDVASGRLEKSALIYDKTGSTVTVGLPMTGVGHTPSVQVTFRCGPHAGE